MPRTKQFDREEVLEKAMELFWIRGYNATSIQDLVDHLGINRASLYDTYGGKHALFEEAFVRYKQLNMVAMEEIFGNAPTIRDGIEQLFRASIEKAVNDKDQRGCFILNTTTEMCPEDSGLTDMIQANNTGFIAFFTDLLKKGKKDGSIPEDMEVGPVAQTMLALYQGVGIVGKANPDRKMLENIVATGLTVLND